MRAATAASQVGGECLLWAAVVCSLSNSWRWVAGLCTPDHPAPGIRSAGWELLDSPSASEASSALLPQPNPLCLGPAVPAGGIGLPSPDVRRVAVSTKPTPSAGVLKVSSSRCLHDWRAARCPQVSTSFPRGLYARSEKLLDSIGMRSVERKGTLLREGKGGLNGGPKKLDLSFQNKNNIL